MSVMVKFENRLTGSDMWVSSERVEEYKAAGHTLAADLGTRPKVEPVKVADDSAPEEPKKKVVRKKK